ncbi:MAG TPA: competence/damage-inducible protein A [Firmicutes bacterium]|jgi:nicotinamide-nucleotide amidase|nr:competence/damage-inducible protein A [Bacillota bacterium]
MKAEIIATGTELLLGQTVNTNARFLSEKLAQMGIDVYWHTVVGDNAVRLEAALRLALSRSDIIITSGGLGPTMDDLTKETVAKVLQLPLEVNAEWERQLINMFASRGSKMTQNNYKQALLPRGAKLITNDYGTAPGIWLEHRDKIIVLLPGPPRELEPMFIEKIMPLLPSSGSSLVSRTLKVVGLGESSVEDKLAEIIAAQTNPTIAPLAKLGEVHLRLTAKARSRTECQELLDETEAKLTARLGNAIYARDEQTMGSVVAELLSKNKLSLALAESCTGGYLAHTLTNIPGSSSFFSAGLVTYSNEAKSKLLGIPLQFIEEHDAVSAEVGRAMASQVREVAESDLGMGITGIAGPTGGTADKPVGLVYIALATPTTVTCQRFNFFGKRENIKERAVMSALNMLRLYLIQLG